MKLFNNNESPLKKRIYFYSFLIGISFLIGYLPIFYAPPGGYGLAGIGLIFLWGGLLVIDIIAALIYEFTHLPDKNEINFKSLSKFSLISFIISLLCLLFISVMAVLILSLQENIKNSDLIPFIPFILLVLIIFYQYRLVKSLKTISRKVVIITTLFTISFLVYTLVLTPELLKEYKQFKKKSVYNKSLLTNDLEKCFTVEKEDYCKKEFAIKNNDVQLCLKIPSLSAFYKQNKRYECLSAIAVNTNDGTLCDKMDQYMGTGSEEAGIQCRKKILTKRYNELTSGLTDEEIIGKAVDENNLDICLAIEHIDYRNNCTLEVAKINNINFCEKIDRINGREQMFSCYSFYGYKIFAINDDDKDKDGLYDYLEKYVLKTNPLNPDSDADGYLDGDEVKNGYNPLVSGN